MQKSMSVEVNYIGFSKRERTICFIIFVALMVTAFVVMVIGIGINKMS